MVVECPEGDEERNDKEKIHDGWQGYHDSDDGWEGLSTGESWHTLSTLVWERWLDSSQTLFKENGSDGSSAMGVEYWHVKDPINQVARPRHCNFMGVDGVAGSSWMELTTLLVGVQ